MSFARRNPEYEEQPWLKRHGLGIASIALLALWFFLYIPANPSTHAGGFFGNAIADWMGTVLTVFGTKYLYEIGSAESNQPKDHPRARLHRFMYDHSLTIFLLVTGLAWLWLYLHMDSNGSGSGQYRIGVDAGAGAGDSDQAADREGLEGVM